MSCIICDHPRRAEIDASTAAGAIPRTLPARFGVKKLDIERHLVHPLRQLVERTHEVSIHVNPLVPLSLRHEIHARNELTPSEPERPRQLLTQAITLLHRAFAATPEDERLDFGERVQEKLRELNEYLGTGEWD